ncbi:MAG: Rrf2 family transcriptional regulator, partial [Eggerthellaceae bacterium]|nr:Rrf2 family transcriptional regulator [Eggerthellaceae bacterium]
MLVTTKGRYAMRLMTYIASFPDRKVALREVAENEALSVKYLEQLAHDMVRAELLKSVRGHGGGYMLARDASAITAGDVLRATEGTTVPVACAALEEDGPGCPREQTCSTIEFWAGLDKVIEDYVDGVALSSLVDARAAVV